MENNKLNKYEIMLILDSENKDNTKSSEEINEDLMNLLRDKKYEVTLKDNYVKKFAYKINDKEKGHYFVLEANVPSESIVAFDKECLIRQKQKEILRYLIINLDTEKLTRVHKKGQKKQYNDAPTYRQGGYKGPRREGQEAEGSETSRNDSNTSSHEENQENKRSDEPKE